MDSSTYRSAEGAAALTAHYQRQCREGARFVMFAYVNYLELAAHRWDVRDA